MIIFIKIIKTLSYILFFFIIKFKNVYIYIYIYIYILNFILPWHGKIKLNLALNIFDYLDKKKE